jgi:hypothetical protein
VPYWTAGRIANQIHRQVLAPHGFVRRGRECELHAGGLRKTLTVHTRTNSAHPQVQLLTVVAVAGLPTPVTSHRCDSLGVPHRRPPGATTTRCPAAPTRCHPTC